MPRRVRRLHLGLRRGPAAQRASEAVMGVAGGPEFIIDEIEMPAPFLSADSEESFGAEPSL